MARDLAAPRDLAARTLALAFTSAVKSAPRATVRCASRLQRGRPNAPESQSLQITNYK
jgi:hypothetical protein